MALEPITRQEKIIAGQDLTPITRMEKFLKNFGGGGGGGGVFEVFEATTNNIDTLVTAPSLEDIAACYSKGRIPVIRLTVNAEGGAFEYICTGGFRMYSPDIIAGLVAFTCVYNSASSGTSPDMEYVSIVYTVGEEPFIMSGPLTTT